jgi:hypothetical protein
MSVFQQFDLSTLFTSSTNMWRSVAESVFHRETTEPLNNSTHHLKDYNNKTITIELYHLIGL